MFGPTNMAKELKKYDDDPSKWIKQHTAETRGQTWSVDVPYEHLLGPEILSNPDYTALLPTVIDKTIQQSPKDTRRGLYRNVGLPGAEGAAQCSRIVVVGWSAV